MPLETTCIGSYPKPEFLKIPDWFNQTCHYETRDYDQFKNDSNVEDLEQSCVDAARTVLEAQTSAGVKVPTDGEVRRDNYIHYHCRHLEGFDTWNMEEKSCRNGAYTCPVPVIRSKVKPVERDIGFLCEDYRKAQALTSFPVKVTVPGPLTICDTVLDKTYNDEAALGFELASALNVEILELVKAGCKYIQVDEPLFARLSDKAVAFGIKNLERCFKDVPKSVTRCVHICCGYPDKVDSEGYLKAEPKAYFKLAKALDDCACVDAVSIEDAHCHNDLSLLKLFTRTKVIFGCIAIAKSRVETVDEVAARLTEALKYIDEDRLIAAPDCGLAMLPAAIVEQKLKVMCEAAARVGKNPN